MNGPAVQGVTTYDPVPSTYSVAGTGEYNADGMGDILFEDNAGNLFHRVHERIADNVDAVSSYVA